MICMYIGKMSSAS